MNIEKYQLFSFSGSKGSKKCLVFMISAQKRVRVDDTETIPWTDGKNAQLQKCMASCRQTEMLTQKMKLKRNRMYLEHLAPKLSAMACYAGNGCGIPELQIGKATKPFGGRHDRIDSSLHIQVRSAHRCERSPQLQIPCVR